MIETLRTSLAYKLVVAGMVLSAMNSIRERLNLSSKPIEPKDIIGFYVSPPGLDKKPMLPGVANFETANFMFIFRDAKLYCVMNTQTNVESVEHYREWAKMPSLVNSNEAYQMATNWLSSVYVDVAALNRKYPVDVWQRSFWATPPTNWGEQGSNLTKLPLYYVTWTKGDYQAAKVGIFGPTKQFIGLTIGDPDRGEDAWLCNHVYFMVTNQKELLAMTNVPMRMEATNQDLLRRLRPRPPPETLGPR
jgi:hypothetical protein